MTAVMMLRNSERGTWKTCRHRWQWTWLDERQAREAPRALRFGDLIHQSLAVYYKPGIKRGPHPARTFERLYQKQAKELQDQGFDIWSDEKWVDALPLGIGMLEGYVPHFADWDAEFEVISSEQVFKVLIVAERPSELPVDWPRILRFRIVGTLDGVWRHRSSGRAVFKEYKTATAITEDGLAMDEQPSMYFTYAPKRLQRMKILRPGEIPREILYSFLRKAVPDDDRPQNTEGKYLNKPSKDALLDRCAELGIAGRAPKKVDDLITFLRAKGEQPELLGAVSKVQPAPYFHRLPVHRNPGEREILHRRVVAEAFEINAARHGRMFLGKNPGPLHNPNCRGCPVREACEVHEADGDYQSILNASTTNWSPYEAHELPERF